MNWLDYVFAVLAVLFVLQGIKQGFSRLALSLAATVLGLILAAWFYGVAGALLLPYVSKPAIAHFLGFLLIFVIIQILGTLFGWGLSKLFKWTGLGWLDRALGAVFGVLKAALVATILVMILVAFPMKPIPQAVAESYTGPYLIEASYVISHLAPRELRDGFSETYDRVKKWWSEHRGQPGVPDNPTAGRLRQSREDHTCLCCDDRLFCILGTLNL